MSNRPSVWNDRGCAPGKADPETFFPPGDTTAPPAAFKEAKAICKACPVVLKCLEWTMETEAELGDFSRWGVAGGLSPAERSQLARSRRGGDLVA